MQVGTRAGSSLLPVMWLRPRDVAETCAPGRATVQFLQLRKHATTSGEECDTVGD